MEQEEPLLVSTSLFGGSLLFFVLSLILPVASTTEAVVAVTTLENTSLSMFDRLTGLGIGLLIASLLVAAVGTYWTYTGKSGLLFGILSFLLGAIPAIAANNVSDLTDIDSASSTEFGATAIWIALVLALAAGLVSKFVKK